MPKTDINDIFDFNKKPGKVKSFIKKIKEKLKSKKVKSDSYKGGVIIPKICKCKNYKAISTRGVVIPNCIYCGGEPKQLRFI